MLHGSYWKHCCAYIIYDNQKDCIWVEITGFCTEYLIIEWIVIIMVYYQFIYYLSFNEEWDKDNKCDCHWKWQLFEAKMANYNMSTIKLVV